MAVLKLKYKRNGKVKKIKMWYIDFRDHNGISRRMPGYHDKGDSETLEKEITNLIRALKANLPISISEAKQAFISRDAKIKNSLIKFGLLDKTSAPKKLIDLVADFKKTILVNKSGKGYTQADQIACRLNKIITDCRFESWQDVTADRTNPYIHELDLKPQTKKFYVVSFRRFARWIIKNGYGETMPELKVVKVPRRPERHLERDEYLRLLEATKTAPKRFGMTGWERYLCYWMGVESGLRCNEMRQLTPSHIEFTRGRVFVPGEGTKNSNSAFQNITQDLSDLLKAHCEGLTGRIFNIPHQSANMIRRDAKDAGIKTRTLHGRIKFHSLRHTTASFYLAATNGNMQIVSNIMRHSNITITVNRYGHMLQGTRESAVELMSKFTVPKEKDKGKAAG